MRKAATGYTSWVEQMRERGQTGKVIKAVLGVHAGRKHQDGLSMDTLRCRTGEVTGDPAVVHTEITDVFRDHYAIPLDFDNKLHNAPVWELFVKNRALFGSVYADSNIPTYLLDMVWVALGMGRAVHTMVAMRWCPRSAS